MKPIYLSVKQKETGENIRRLMKSNGYTVKDVQEVMGFENPQAVYKWLSGKSLPSLENLLILSKLLNISLENILVIDEDINILRSINTQSMLKRINDILVLQNGIRNYRIRLAIIETDVQLSKQMSVYRRKRHQNLKYRKKRHHFEKYRRKHTPKFKISKKTYTILKNIEKNGVKISCGGRQ